MSINYFEEDTVGKGNNTGYQLFFPFPIVFNVYKSHQLIYMYTVNLPSANLFMWRHR